MLSTDQKIILDAIKENAKTAKKPIDKKTLKLVLEQQKIEMAEATINNCLRKLIHEGFLRLGISVKGTYILVKWEE